MTKESRDYLEMSFRAIQCFANDGTLLPDELSQIIDIALRDGVMDHNEKRVLTSIIRKLKPEEVTPLVREHLNKLRECYDVY